jgi:hypothetical protein
VNPIALVQARLAKYPHVRFAADESSVRIHSEDAGGFEIGLFADGGAWVVHFDGWHEHFPTGAEALNCVAFGLSPSCRLKVTYRGSFPASWTVQSLEDGRWVIFGTTGVLLFPFWRSPRVEYRQNRVITAIGDSQGHVQRFGSDPQDEA